ncbi:HCL464Wp [Eremothecium sinecaudum]|uniref:Regulator of rDNA transcription 14 n=1 Tax=Eremothecium sinecaudum TaxID=45286 RepID=A0A109UYW9_9SACH|nr:HCL464Wp [Eremothecium sinecaudum]AMD19687.1 HCL464Wp [Eremothecium sinecaudum]
MYPSSSKAQATSAVNNLLESIFPGVGKVTNKKNNRKLKSNTQLIDRNLRRRVEIEERDTDRIKKKAKKQSKDKLRKVKRATEELVQKAKLANLKKHQQEGDLSAKEKKYLNSLIKRNISRLKGWQDEEAAEDLSELQAQVLEMMTGDEKNRRAKMRNQKKFKLKEKKAQANVDHRYPGLTPGLAPVGLSDEESSEEVSDDED